MKQILKNQMQYVYWQILGDALADVNIFNSNYTKKMVQDNINKYMPDWMSEKKTLFSAKYPAFERCTKKKKAKGKLEVEEQANIIAMPRKSVSRDTKTDIDSVNKGGSKEDSDAQLEHAMEEIFREKDVDVTEKGKARIFEPLTRKRVRKLPKR